ncbi:hypothetical protein [Atopobium sp. oral taxon 416]|nr:hypothetical protein [Atopobium sp. oral taxon 416]
MVAVHNEVGVAALLGIRSVGVCRFACDIIPKLPAAIEWSN